MRLLFGFWDFAQLRFDFERRSVTMAELKERCENWLVV